MAENPESGDSSPTRPRRSWKRWLIRTAIVIVGLLFLAGAFVGVAEHRTSQPTFCASCHIMEPYYESWTADLHGGKLDIACVDCHYAPGERTTINAKFRGLSQVTSYFSGRYGATRPRAHVSDKSCMTARCHGDERFMDKPLLIGNVSFKHANHLTQNANKDQAIQQQLAELRKSLAAIVQDEGRMKQLDDVANHSTPANELLREMSELVDEWKVSIDATQLKAFSELTHRGVRLAQLASMQCTNCHTYAAPDPTENDGHAKHHFAVNTTSCYTCHFNNEGFNTGTNTCLMCHNLPREDITVHKTLSAEASAALGTPDLSKPPIKMNHQSILERKVGCVACHADVAREDSQVTRRDCEHCHNQSRFFTDWKEPFTLELVTHYHDVHIRDQRAKCLDCHTEIHHELARDDEISEGTFIKSSMANCAQCHPNQHTEQVNLLRGVGGEGVAHSDPNLMFGSRTNCYGCHTEQGTNGHGDGVLKATENACLACHGDRHADTFEKWKLGLELSMTDADEAYQNGEKMLSEATAASQAARDEATALLKSAKKDLQLVKRGNGLHNVTYAIELLDSVTSRCQQAMAVLSN